MQNYVVSSKRIRITKQDKRVVVSREGVEIQHRGKPLTGETIGAGFVYLVADCSGSMATGKLDQARKGAIDFARDARNKGYLIGLIQFESSATHICEPQRETRSLERHLVRMEAGGGTNMAEAIRIANHRLEDREGPRVMVVITDGMPNIGEPTGERAALREAKNAKKNGVDIITIGTDDADWDFLKKIATRASLATFVTREKLAQAITSAAQMLPAPPGEGGDKNGTRVEGLL